MGLHERQVQHSGRQSHEERPRGCTNGVSSEESQRTAIITKCDGAQYSPAASARMTGVYGEGVDIISRIEAMIKR
ncbi:MAG: hypothetical protein ACLRMJ_11930 [Alistipes finegoldii]